MKFQHKRKFGDLSGNRNEFEAIIEYAKSTQQDAPYPIGIFDLFAFLSFLDYLFLHFFDPNESNFDYGISSVSCLRMLNPK